MKILGNNTKESVSQNQEAHKKMQKIPISDETVCLGKQ